jgi:uncharacterized small protein (DUF1192 family)
VSTPEALIIADSLNPLLHYPEVDEAAAELRRQHAEIERLTAERDALRTAAEAMVAWLRAEEDHTGTTFMQRVEMCDHAQKLLEAAVGSWKPAAVPGDKP